MGQSLGPRGGISRGRTKGDSGAAGPGGGSDSQGLGGEGRGEGCLWGEAPRETQGRKSLRVLEGAQPRCPKPLRTPGRFSQLCGVGFPSHGKVTLMEAGQGPTGSHTEPGFPP